MPIRPATGVTSHCSNRELDDKYLGIDTDWFQKGGGGYVSRAQTQALGELAFCYRTKGLKYYRDPQVLEKIRRAFAGVVKHVSDEGKFTWTKNLNDYGYDGEVHEHGWRVEPLILAMIWVGQELAEQDRAPLEAALQRASTWLAAHPLTQHNNRGAVVRDDDPGRPLLRQERVPRRGRTAVARNHQQRGPRRRRMWRAHRAVRWWRSRRQLQLHWLGLRVSVSRAIEQTGTRPACSGPCAGSPPTTPEAAAPWSPERRFAAGSSIPTTYPTSCPRWSGFPASIRSLPR